MRNLFAIERRLQELERRLENLHRFGDVTDTKYDSEKKRWYVKMADGPDAEKMAEGSGTASTSSTSSGAGGQNLTWSTPDWVPWGGFSNATIKISCPPRKGQKVMMLAPNGYPEMGSVHPFTYSPDNPSPAGDPDQIHWRVEAPTQKGKPGSDNNKILDHVWTQDGATTSIGNSKHQITKGTIAHTTDDHSVKSKTHSVDTGKVTVTASDSHTTTTKSHTVTTQNQTVTTQNTTIKSINFSLGGKVMINCGFG